MNPRMTPRHAAIAQARTAATAPVEYLVATALAHRRGTPPTPGVGRGRGDRGEGVISAAIAVLIMAFLGALMWASFQVMWHNTEKNTNDHLSTMTSQ